VTSQTLFIITEARIEATENTMVSKYIRGTNSRTKAKMSALKKKRRKRVNVEIVEDDMDENNEHEGEPENGDIKSNQAFIEKFDKLVPLQLANGYWNLTSAFVNVLGIDIDTLFNQTIHFCQSQ
jgi:hypothetical protein